ncbi:hypothetical protein GCM10008171_33860 [Methylopila jiangsuensis]|uniref:DUF91 domain-containing protein n=1 Tax=Methylopila jiangsuensis TaxID=586230 RepID=A0A9W6N5E1_9HYPH|nr:hypothetical protein [Methylopila jiangsuensis]MDR6284480.1 hypothetical protein [Methylopila jiangsuensis]GLK78132.1 hypothetical protein GCM10008171_33860 [Methylopila jiangsuensis]
MSEVRQGAAWTEIIVTAGVFVLTDAATLIPMKQASFVTEDEFQNLLASFPELLVGDQINSQSPRRFILVSREQSIADHEGGGGRWSVDHLFIDQDGIPTLVEVKRSSDTRIRREVIGQMLDYAANAVVHWPVQNLRDRYEARCQRDGIEPAQTLHDTLGWVGDADLFWSRVDTNLQAGKVRLLFVADIIPRELRRVVEFLNVQMSPAEVLAIELRQYQGEGLRTLVPMVIGQTQAAIRTKSSTASAPEREWDEQSFLDALAMTTDEQGIANARSMIDWMKANGERLAFNTNSSWRSVSPLFVRPDGEVRPFAIWTDGAFGVQFEYMKNRPVFGELHEREELLRRINETPGISLPMAAASGRKTTRLTALTPDAVSVFLRAMDWFAERWRTG